LSGQTRLDGDASTWFSQGIELQRGMRGDLIAQMQGIIGAGADGAFGRLTEAKLKQWQKLHGLAESGTVNLSAWNLMTSPAGTAGAGDSDLLGEVAAEGGGLLAELLSGDKLLDGEAGSYFSSGITFQKGMRGELVKTVQSAIGAGADGAFGPATEAKLKAFQKKHGLAVTGAVDETTWAIILTARGSGGLADLKGEDDFARMWAAHPHNYQDDYSQNTSSEDLRTQLGLTERDAENTCALRMSTMLNRLGDDTALTTERGRQAGLDKMRSGGLYMPSVKDAETANTKDRVILSAKEMWTYIEHHRGAPDEEWPARGRYKNAEEAQAGADALEASMSGKKGLVAFDKIFGYGGSGHVDLFDGQKLSDGSWYPSEKIRIWYVVKGEAEGASLT